MEPLSNIVTTIRALLTLATAVINLVTAIRSRTRRSSGRDQQHPDGGQHADSLNQNHGRVGNWALLDGAPDEDVEAALTSFTVST